MTREVTTNFGEPLSAESKKRVNEVRQNVNQPLHPKFNTDFNIYRFVMSAERQFKNRKEIIDMAAKTLNNHLRIRKCLELDDMPDIPFSQNPIFKHRYLPCGEIQDFADNHNRLLWYIEYATISVEDISHGAKSSEACKYQFWQFEHMLRKINHQEETSGKLSSLRHIIDMTGYEINPFTMIFVSSGTLSYYSQLFHYENYPELVYPIEMVNIAKWIHVPYKLIKTMMPTGFSDRFRLHDGNFLETLLQDISMENIPTTLGGTNTDIKCIPAVKKPLSEYPKPSSQHITSLETIHLPTRKTKHITVDVKSEGCKLSWYFATDGDVYFGVFYEPLPESNGIISDKKDKDIDTDSKEMAYPWWKLAAKLVHEIDYIECKKPGRYYIVFHNCHSWLQSRNVKVLVQLMDADGGIQRCYQDGGREKVPEDKNLLLSIKED